ncbi:NUOB22 [Auxenochlorella protothecoides x Auxenochlorella symbiontica]|uniref:NADH dehydrogenase [ubiquinone] 1 beta subcomplex subunit 9 n=1 Tax=Auxenochlorella protothecoides TaxID=3075 RepID=A0A1D2A884_AUXPR
MATALQKARTVALYRDSLKTLLSWAVARDIFYVKAAELRAEFDQNATLTGHDQIERALARGEERLRSYAHPDPYIVPYRPGGSLYARNPPFPDGISMHMDFGREGGH